MHNDFRIVAFNRDYHCVEEIVAKNLFRIERFQDQLHTPVNVISLEEKNQEWDIANVVVSVVANETV